MRKKIEKILKEHIVLNLWLVYGSVIFISAVMLYYLLPTLLNYGAGTINTDFDREMSGGVSYFEQYSIVVSGIIILGYFIFRYIMREFNRNKNNINENNEKTKELQDKIRNKSFNLPIIIYIMQAFLPPIILAIVFIMMNFVSFQDSKVIIIIFTFSTLTSIISYVFARKIFSNILRDMNNTDIAKSFRLNLRYRMILQLLPLVMVCILFTFLLAYSRFMEDKGNILFKYYQCQIINITENMKISSVKDLDKVLDKISYNNVKDVGFIVTPKQKFIQKNGELSNFFVRYAQQLAKKHNGKIYDYYGTDMQGMMYPIKINGEQWYVGIKYNVYATDSVNVVITNAIILLLLNIVILYYFAKSISEDISSVAKSLSDIAEGGRVNLEKQLPVTSNDEIGDLVIAFNKIQELTKNNIKVIKRNEEMLAKQDRLVGIGQLAGGMAHDINTPLGSINGVTYIINKLNSECKKLVQEDVINREVLNDKLSKVDDRIDDINVLCKKISQIVNSVRGHMRNISSTNIKEFCISDILSSVTIMVDHQLKQTGCQLIKENIVEDILVGDSGKLEQVVMNLIVNAIQAYGDKSGQVIVNTVKEDDKIVITVKDAAGGIPKEFQKYIFNEILTTKGTQGTGLGLYLCHNIITGHFGGDMGFVTDEGKGTTFYIKILINSNKVEKKS